MAWGVKCNVKAPHRFLRHGALCWVTLTNPGWGGERIEVTGLSRGGRAVQTWVDARDLTNFRPGWFDDSNGFEPGQPSSFESRDEAKIWADRMNERFGSQPLRPHAAQFGRDER